MVHGIEARASAVRLLLDGVLWIQNTAPHLPRSVSRPGPQRETLPIDGCIIKLQPLPHIHSTMIFQTPSIEGSQERAETTTQSKSSAVALLRFTTRRTHMRGAEAARGRLPVVVHSHSHSIVWVPEMASGVKRTDSP